MYGKSIMDIMSDDQITEWKRKIGKRSHALWQDEEYRKKSIVLDVIEARFKP